MPTPVSRTNIKFVTIASPSNPLMPTERDGIKGDTAQAAPAVQTRK
jgi:hypothetical protein